MFYSIFHHWHRHFSTCSLFNFQYRNLNFLMVVYLIWRIIQYPSINHEPVYSIFSTETGCFKPTVYSIHSWTNPRFIQYTVLKPRFSTTVYSIYSIETVIINYGLFNVADFWDYGGFSAPPLTRSLSPDGWVEYLSLFNVETLGRWRVLGPTTYSVPKSRLVCTEW